MSIRYDGDTIHMEGICAVDEADALLKFLEEHKCPRVSVSQCQHMHTALLQLLLSYRVVLEGEAFNPFIWRWVVPALRASTG